MRDLEKIPGFTEICEHAVEEGSISWGNEKPTEIFQAARNLNELSYVDPASLEDIWARLASGAIRLAHWDDLGELTIESVCAIIQNVPKDQLNELVKASIQQLNGAISIDSPENGRKIAASWINAVNKITERAKGRGIELDVISRLEAPSGAPFFVGLKQVLNETPEVNNGLPNISFSVSGNFL